MVIPRLIWRVAPGKETPYQYGSLLGVYIKDGLGPT